jgi:hypothetical protein
MIYDENLFGAFLGLESKSKFFLECGEDGRLGAIRIAAGSYRSELEKNFERTRESRPVKHWPAKHPSKHASKPLHRNFFIDDRLGRHVHPAASSLRIGIRSLPAIEAWFGFRIRQLQSVLRRQKNVDSRFVRFGVDPQGEPVLQQVLHINENLSASKLGCGAIAETS